MKEKITDFFNCLRILKRLIEKNIKKATSCCNLTIDECLILMELKNKETLSITKLSKNLHIDKSNLSRIVNYLSEKDIIRRKKSKEDKRITLLSLTKKGLKKVEIINKRCEPIYRKLFENISGENRKTIFESISILLEILENSGKK